jgi:hypothetical protein
VVYTVAAIEAAADDKLILSSTSENARDRTLAVPPAAAS